MSFRGKPSKGCSKCRQRKVKCDETRPTCQRCIKGGFECQYRDSFDLFFRNQSTQVAHKAQVKWRSRAKRLPDLDSTSLEGNSNCSTPESASHRPSIPPKQSLIPFNPSHARDRFFFDFCTPFDTLLPHQAPPLGFITRISRQSPEHLCLQHSLAAASYANFAGRYRSKEAGVAAVESYGKALKELSIEMANPSGSCIYENLVSICLLGMYELISTPEMSERGSWIAHTDGASALLNQAATIMKTPDPAISGIYHWIFSQMLVCSLSRNMRPTLPLRLRDVFLHPEHCSYDLFSFMYDAACVGADWKATLKDFRSGRPVDANEIQSFISKSEAIDTGLEKWAENLPEEYNYKKSPITLTSTCGWLNSLLTSPEAPEIGHRYTNLGVAARWALWRTTRLILNGSLLEMCRTMSDAPPLGLDVGMPINIHKRRNIASKMLSLANNMCEAAVSNFTTAMPANPEADTSIDVPGMRGFLLLWPLYIAGMFYKWTSLHELDVNNRREWIKTMLLFIHDELSIQKAGAFLRTLEYGYTPGDGVRKPGYLPEAEARETGLRHYIIPDLPANAHSEVALFEHTFTTGSVLTS